MDKLEVRKDKYVRKKLRVITLVFLNKDFRLREWKQVFLVFFYIKLAQVIVLRLMGILKSNGLEKCVNLNLVLVFNKSRITF